MSFSIRRREVNEGTLGLKKGYARNIDVVIPYHEKDSECIRMCITACVNNVCDLGNVYVVGKEPHFEFKGVRFIHEERLFPDGFSAAEIERRCAKESPDLVARSGWLFQQFIKMASSYSIPDLEDYYLVVDADVVFLRKMSFFKSGRMLLSRSEEFHRPYFDFYEKLLGETPFGKASFVAHHMLMCKPVVLELLDIIEKRFNKVWYDAILDTIDNNGNLMFSEYETYGHYLANHYPDSFVLRKLRNVQSFRIWHLLKLLFGLADYVTIHDYKKPKNNPKTSPCIYRLLTDLVRRRLKKQTTGGRLSAKE